MLALLVEGDAYGGQLRTSFEERTGGTWALNIGQVYQTLERLVRDGLVVTSDASGPDVPPQARTMYALTPAGRTEVQRWLAEPVRRLPAPRDELAMKVAMALRLPGVDLAAILDAQRAATMLALQALTALRRRSRAAGTAPAEPWVLVLERLVFDTEAELRWLDHCESTLLRTGSGR